MRTKKDKAAYQREYRKAHPDKYRQYNRNRPPMTEEQIVKRQARDRSKYYRRKDKGLPTNPKKRDPFKVRAGNVLRRAVKSGKVIKPKSCQECGWHVVEAHHPDYNKPLDVAWLCRLCHGKRHRKNI